MATALLAVAHPEHLVILVLRLVLTVFRVRTRTSPATPSFVHEGMGLAVLLHILRERILGRPLKQSVR